MNLVRDGINGINGNISGGRFNRVEVKSHGSIYLIKGPHQLLLFISSFIFSIRCFSSDVDWLLCR